MVYYALDLRGASDEELEEDRKALIERIRQVKAGLIRGKDARLGMLESRLRLMDAEIARRKG